MQATVLYAYCGNSPFLFIDPFGLADVIIYTTGVKKGDESDWTKQAVWMKNELENNDREVIMLSVSDRNSFESAWNSLGIDENGNEYSIDNVYIYSHGTERALILQDGSSTEALSINGLNLGGEKIGNINNLQVKEMKTLYLYSCNSGNLDQYLDGTEDNRGSGNVASVFSTKVANGVVKAYDGNVGFGIKILGNLGIGGYRPRLSNDQSKFDEITKHYKHYHREPRGVLTYYNGEYKPFGYFPNTQFNAA